MLLIRDSQTHLQIKKNVVLIFCKCAIQRAEAGKVWALVKILLLWDGKIAKSKEFDNHYDYYYTASIPVAPSVLLRCLLQLFTNFILVLVHFRLRLLTLLSDSDFRLCQQCLDMSLYLLSIHYTIDDIY